MKDFIKISRYAGMREDLVQAGGGNSSYKESSDKMYIKASGYQLAELSEYEGYAAVNPQTIRTAFLSTENLGDMTDEKGKEILKDAFIEGKRPSIETFLHAITGKYTLHTHPVVVNVLACRKSGMQVLRELFPDALMVPYATPGIELAKAYFNAYKAKKAKDTDVVFLQNHGLVVSGNTAEAVIEKTESITMRIEEYLHCDYSAYHRTMDIWRFFPEKVVWKVNDVNVLNAYACLGDFWNHRFCPDCIVFLGKRALKVNSETTSADIEAHKAVFGEPVVVAYEDNLYLLCDNVKKAMEIQSVLSFSAQVMQMNQDEECNFLMEEEQNLLLNWDAEKYRRSLR